MAGKKKVVTRPQAALKNYWRRINTLRRQLTLLEESIADSDLSPKEVSRLTGIRNQIARILVDEESNEPAVAVVNFTPENSPNDGFSIDLNAPDAFDLAALLTADRDAERVTLVINATK